MDELRERAVKIAYAVAYRFQDKIRSPFVDAYGDILAIINGNGFCITFFQKIYI